MSRPSLPPKRAAARSRGRTIVTLVLLASFAPATALAALRVVATVPDLGAVAREIGGDSVAVDVLVPPSQDPHYVDARPNLVLPLARADLLIVNGLELEVGWLPPLLRSCRNPAVQLGQPGYFDGGLIVERKQAPGTLPTRAQGDVHAAGNPHYTHDPASVAALAPALGERLAQLDPAHAAAYRARAGELARRLQSMVAAARAKVAAVPAARRQLVAYHASLVYLFDTFGLHQVATVEPLPGIPPNPSHVAKVLATLRSSGAPAIVQEPYYPRSISKTLAKLAKVSLVILPGGASFATGETYTARAQRTIEALYAAIGAN